VTRGQRAGLPGLNGVGAAAAVPPTADRECATPCNLDCVVVQHCAASQKYLLLLVWHAPLGVRSAKRRHQSPEWTILSHSYRLIQGEIV